MNQAVLGLTLTYVALAALLLGIFILTRLPAWLKIACVIAVSGFYYLTYHSYQGLLGWPTGQLLPEKFQLMASSIREPDDETGDSGNIHIWVSAINNGQPALEPRAYELPYDLDLHSALEEALKEQRRGNVKLGRSKQELDPNGLPRDSTRFGQKRQNLEFYDLPDPQLPEK